VTRFLALFVAFLTLSSCEFTTETDTTYYISHDDGGWIPSYQETIARLNQQGKLVVLDGYCASACTMFLGADNVCIMPDTQFEFHGSLSWDGKGKDYWDNELSKYYPTELRRWFYESNAYKLQGLARILPTDDVVRLSGVPYCY